MAATGLVKKAPALRRVHLDFHTPDFQENVGGKLDAAKFAAVLAKGEVQQAAFFAKCHYGNAYYPTKVGRTHPNLKCDMLGKFVNAGKKKGVRTFAYYSLQFDVWYGKQHPDCVQHPQPFSETRCGAWTPTCINGPYGDYAREQLREVAEWYDIAGVWLDIVGYYPWCVCPRCRERYEKETGKRVPFDDSKPEDGIGREFLDWQRRLLDDYTDGLAKMLDEIRPGCVLLSNTATGIKEKASGETNQGDGEWCEEALCGRPHMQTGVSMYSSLFDSAKDRRPFEILSQRFHMGWGDWTLRPLEALKYDAATILAHGGLVSIGDQLYGDGGFEPIVYERIGETYKWLKPRQEFCGDTEGAAEIGVFGISDRYKSDQGGIFYDGSKCQHGEGLFKLMLDSKIPASVLSSLNALDTGRYNVLLVDENLPDDVNAQKALEQFVEKGGKLISVGIGPKRYWDLLGIKSAAPLPTEVSYIKVRKSMKGDLSMPVLARIKGMGAGTVKGAKPLAFWAHPLCARTKDTFFSHQHAPQGPVTKEPAIWRVKHGKGSVVCIAAPIATDYWKTSYQPLKTIVAYCLDELLAGKRQVFVENLPVDAEVTIRNGGKSTFVHLVIPSISRPGMDALGCTFNIDEPIMIHDVRMRLRLPRGKKCTRAAQLNKKLRTITKKGYTELKLSPFTTHTVIKFDFAPK